MNLLRQGVRWVKHNPKSAAYLTGGFLLGVSVPNFVKRPAAAVIVGTGGYLLGKGALNTQTLEDIQNTQ